MNPIHGNTHPGHNHRISGLDSASDFISLKHFLGRVLIKEANVTLMISDMNRSVKFYVETLGLRLKTRYGDYFAQIQAPGTIIALHPSSKTNPIMKGGSTSIGFSVDDLDKVIQELKAKGVMFTSGVVDDGQVRIASFMDPDGNQLYLSQSRWG